ncbi:MAG: tRNA (N6-threonylcarbamoyladenosine(37)-N6)-methyltransferase TrmO [Candidatus Micrarchaeia archaeon]
MVLKRVGVVENKVKEHRFGGWKSVVSRIVLDDAFKAGLDGLKDYSHVVVVFWMSNVKTCKIKHFPQGKKDQGVPEVGIFACRCPARPNPIAITTVKLLEVGENFVSVEGLDAVDGSPVLDIKPFTPEYDVVENFRVPQWVSKLDF